MRLTARPPWVAGSARNAKTASWHSPSLMLGVPCGAVVHLMGWSRREPCPRNRSVAHAMLLPIPAPDRGRHDAITARSSASGSISPVRRNSRRVRTGTATWCDSSGRAWRREMRANDGTRTAAEILVDQLVVHGTTHAFCVPGESYIAALDAFHDRDIAI